MMRFTTAAAMACACLALAIGAAEARPKHHRHHARPGSAVAVQCVSTAPGRETCPNAVAPLAGRRGARATDANGNEARAAARRGLCHVDTAGGPITIDCGLADRMKGFIADVVARGFKGRIKCFSLSRSHVARSLHFSGNACDFAQRGWNRTVRPMYQVADLAAKWGLRDGCSFRDCGHIDSGRGSAVKPWPARLAELKRKGVPR